MPFSPALPVWKEAPFLRLLVPFIAGIISQWYLPAGVFAAWGLLIAGCLVIWLFSRLRLWRQYQAPWLNGIWLYIILFTTGILLLHYKDIRNKTTCITRLYCHGNAVLATVNEPLTEKGHSFKTIASVQAVVTDGGAAAPACGNLLLYFQKDSTASQFQYGSQLIIYAGLQPVKNSGNPGAFDYERYCTFQGIFYQVYLKPGEYAPLKIKNENLFRKCLFSTRDKLVAILKKYIPGKRQAGLAEAMLIGYKEDLDKNLVQSYTNTGVVHIIAISGLHLGLIYWLLMLLCKPLAKLPKGPKIQVALVVLSLWLFSLLAGGSPSVMRSAVMFTCLVIGGSMNRKTSIYNSLAASAFILLCYDPFWLWDAGFQLSYAAVLSLAIFMKPIYNLLFIQNKLCDHIWKAIAVTLAAQVLTVPVSVYHFHQFPNLFLVANLLAVPLSGVIIIGEIVLCAVYCIPMVATGTGYVLHLLINWLNGFIDYISAIPFATWNGLQINLTQLVCLYICLTAITWWLLQKKRWAVHVALMALLLFTTLQQIANAVALKQKKLVVYNIPKCSAIDYIIGRQFFFKGDSTVTNTPTLNNLYVEPGRLFYGVTRCYNTGNLMVKNGFFRIQKTCILQLDRPFRVSPATPKMNIDVVILSHNCVNRIGDLTGVFTIKTIVFDSSNSTRKTSQWRQECAQLGISCFSVPDQGAFVLNLY